MRVFWFHSGLMPAACEALGYSKRVSCGWLESMLDALLEINPNLQFCLLGLDSRPCDITIERVRHVSFQVDGPTWYDTIPKCLAERAKNLICEFNPDVIHIQGTEYFYGNFASEVYCGKPVIVSIQGLISGCHPHVAGYLSLSATKRTKFNLRYFIKGESILHNQDIWQKHRAIQEQRVIKAHQNFIGRTEWDKGWVYCLNHNARYFQVNENMRKPFYCRARSDVNFDRYRIYCGAAAAYPLKGVHWLLRAIAMLKDEFPGIRLRIAGSEKVFSTSQPLMVRLKEEAYSAYLRRLVRQLGIEQNIVALPLLTAESVAEELERAELFVLPSLCENSPNSLCEAMLIGTPAIATFVGGVPSVIENGVEGKLVPPGDPAALAWAIRSWFLNQSDATACANAAKITAKKRHDSTANAQATLDVYKKVIGYNG